MSPIKPAQHSLPLSGNPLPAKRLVGSLGGRFATGLGIELVPGNPEEIFKWFLAAMLFAARISHKLAGKTYREFERAGVTSPESIVKTGWNRLVQILDRGGYVRYDYKTADKLLAVSATLIKRYGGNLALVHRLASDPDDLEKKIQSLGKGIGGMTANIFLREMRGIWEKADPLPSEKVIQAGKGLGFLPLELEDGREALRLLRQRWAGEGGNDSGFADFEAALIRHALGQGDTLHGDN